MSATITTVAVKVTAGCRALDIAKGDRIVFTLEAIPRFGVRARNMTRSLWLSGSRRNVPALVVGSTFNLHNGNPLQKVSVVVERCL